MTYFAILTAVGEAKLANATALGVPLQISRMAVGDGNDNLPVPNRLQTALVRETYRADLNELKVDPLNASQIIAELVIPETEGGYWLREMGLYDAAGDLVAVANCPPSYKPQISEGSGRTQVLRMVLIVSSTAAVQLKIDPTVVLATRAYVDSLIAVHMLSADPHPQYKTEVATQAEAEAGASNVKRMTPLRVIQALRAAAAAATETLRGTAALATQGEAETGAENTKIMTPLRVRQAMATATSGIAGIASNLKASATGTSATVSLTADAVSVRDAAGMQKVLNAIALAINSATVGANGLDAGAIAASTWYSLWVIHNPTTSAVAGLLSLSATAPTLPAGFTHFARLGWIRTDGTANKYPLSFAQSGRRARYKVAAGSNLTAFPTLCSGSQGSAPSTWATIATGNFVPPTASAIGVLATATLQNTNNIAVAPNTAHVSTSGSANSAPLAIYQPTASAGGAAAAGDIALESTNIHVIANQFSGSSLVLCTGWEDSQ